MTADGRYIVFDSNRGGGSDLWRIDADGQHMLRLTTGGRSSQPRLTSDGRWVVYMSTADGVPSIWKVTIDGGQPVALTHSPSMWPSVSPDGTQIAYIETDGPFSAGQIVVASLAGARLAAPFPVARGATVNNGLYWAPDGTAVIYRDFNHGLWRQPLGGGAAQQIAGLPDKKIYFIDWSKDGKSLAMSYGDEVRDVVLMNGFR
jgi:Tol biopolymer transport system component